MTDDLLRAHAALRAFMALDWVPDGAPGPSCYLVFPIHAARAALAQAGRLVDGKSPFASDNDGSMTYTIDGAVTTRSVWLGGMSYGEQHRDLVPEKYRALFDEAMARPVPERAS